jgi:hypothetical protein
VKNRFQSLPFKFNLQRYNADCSEIPNFQGSEEQKTAYNLLNGRDTGQFPLTTNEKRPPR